MQLQEKLIIRYSKIGGRLMRYLKVMKYMKKAGY